MCIYIYVYNQENNYISRYTHLSYPSLSTYTQKRKKLTTLKNHMQPFNLPPTIDQLSGHPIERRWPTPEDADHQTTSGLGEPTSITPTRFPEFEIQWGAPQDLGGVPQHKKKSCTMSKK